MCVFLVPAESGEKITLAVSTLITLMVFQMEILNNLPPVKNIPLIGK